MILYFNNVSKDIIYKEYNNFCNNLYSFAGIIILVEYNDFRNFFIVY
jgi:hypothetical protein